MLHFKTQRPRLLDLIFHKRPGTFLIGVLIFSIMHTSWHPVNTMLTSGFDAVGVFLLVNNVSIHWLTLTQCSSLCQLDTYEPPIQSDLCHRNPGNDHWPIPTLRLNLWTTSKAWLRLFAWLNPKGLPTYSTWHNRCNNNFCTLL